MELKLTIWTFQNFLPNTVAWAPERMVLVNVGAPRVLPREREGGESVR